MAARAGVNGRAEVEQLEIELVIRAIRERYGYDFGHYSRASLRRRLRDRMADVGLSNIAELIPRLIHDEEFFGETLAGLSVTVTELFRDPHFYRTLRSEVVPVLRTYPVLKVWHAGCATGEEAWSMAILLHEEGLLEYAQIYATDVNGRSLEIARRAIYKAEDLRRADDRYRKAGGTAQLSDYYREQYGSAGLSRFLQDRVTFASHNLVTDSAFGEMHLVVCRNVLIYFDRVLQDRVLTLFRGSLIRRGFLCLGDKESLDFSDVADDFERVADRARVFRLRPAFGGGGA